MIEVNNRGLVEKHVVDALVIDRWRGGPAVGAVMPHDEMLADGADSSREADLLVPYDLQEHAVLSASHLGRMVFRSLPENQNGGEPIHGAQNAPVCLAGSIKVTADHISPYLRIVLRDGAASAFEFPNQITWESLEVRRGQPHNVPLCFVKFPLQFYGRLRQASDSQAYSEDQREQCSTHSAITVPPSLKIRNEKWRSMNRRRSWSHNEFTLIKGACCDRCRPATDRAKK